MVWSNVQRSCCHCLAKVHNQVSGVKHAFLLKLLCYVFLIDDDALRRILSRLVHWILICMVHVNLKVRQATRRGSWGGSHERNCKWVSTQDHRNCFFLVDFYKLSPPQIFENYKAFALLQLWQKWFESTLEKIWQCVNLGLKYDLVIAVLTNILPSCCRALICEIWHLILNGARIIT